MAPRTGEPTGVAAMIGRDRELATLRDLLADDDPGLVTVTGLPGVGKTHLARAAVDSVGRGVLVPLGTTRDGRLVENVLVGQLPAPGGLSRSAAESLWQSYGGDRVVVVLDAVDRVEGLADAVAGLRAGYPSLVPVLTALRPTGIATERVVRLAPFPVTDDAGAGAAQPAVALFAQHARTAGAELDLSNPHVLADVLSVCRAAGGLPLALELAAARAATLPLGYLARTLWRRGTLGAQDRRRAVIESLDWAVDLCSEPARQALLQLAAFAGPFQLDAAEAVVELPSGHRLSAAFTELVDAHLLELEPSGSGTRFVMAEVVPAFARRRVDGDTLDAARRRHARYFRARSRAGADLVRREWPDIEAAIQHDLRTGHLDDALTAAVCAAPAMEHVAGAAESLQGLLDELLGGRTPDSDVRPELRARALLWSSALHPRDAEDLATTGLWTARRLADATAMARESGDGPALLEALEATVRSLTLTLDMPAAVAVAHEGLELARRLGDERALARFEVWVAMATQQTGDVAATVRLATSAVLRGRAHHEPVAVIYGTQIVLGAPQELRPDLDPPLPELGSLLEDCERAGQALAGMTVLYQLAARDAAADDVRGAAGWVWRYLMVAAARTRSAPIAGLSGVAAVASLALRAGALDDAVRLRESVRALEPSLPLCVPPAVVAAYALDCARLEELVPAARYAALAAEVGGTTLPDANLRAQAVARALAGATPPRPVPHAGPTLLEPLTPRESEVLAALSSGATNREIAAQLGVSPKTVMHHSVAIYRKLGVRGRAAAAVWAQRQPLEAARLARPVGRTEGP